MFYTKYCRFFNNSITLIQAILIGVVMLLPDNSTAQPNTPRLNKITNNLFRIEKTSQGQFHYVLREKTLVINDKCPAINQILLPIVTPTASGHIIEKVFTITDCHFKSFNIPFVPNVYRSCENDHPVTVNIDDNNNDRNLISGNKFDGSLSLSRFTGNLAVAKNRVSDLSISITSGWNIEISENELSKPDYAPFPIMLMQIIKSKYLNIANNVFLQDSNRIMISYCSVEYEISLHNNKAKYLVTDFISDSLQQISLRESPSDSVQSAKDVKKFNFLACVLQGRLDANLPQSNSSIAFRRCRFNSNAQLIISDADTLIFNNCISTEKGMQLKGASKNKPIILKFDNTDVTNIDFNYDEHFALHRWKDPDMTRSVYEKLLVKFQDEKRLESYKRVDIEYFKFRHNGFVNTISLLWWNYGYDKWWVIWWTIFFLFTFSIINMIFWEQVISTYSIEKSKHIANSPFASRFFKILAYTSLIFFSLKVDFDRLSFKKTGPLIYFFVQFSAGLVCLLFILNAILKFP